MAFLVVTSTHYERLARFLLKHHSKFRQVQENAITFLAIDPINRSGAHDIKKLTDVPRGEGQWRLARGRFRFRYDIEGQEVLLKYCGLRRENTY